MELIISDRGHNVKRDLQESGLLIFRYSDGRMVSSEVNECLLFDGPVISHLIVINTPKTLRC